MKLKLFFKNYGVFFRKATIISSFCLFCSLLNSVTWHINQDGTGNFTTIMEGVNAAAEDDTVRVYPGTYYENIVIEQNLSLVSNYEYTGNDEDIYNTILDGNYLSSVIRMMGEEDDLIEVYICGFIIKHGIGWFEDGYPPTRNGGGVLSDYVTLTLRKNIIRDNKAYNGGGICNTRGSLLLTGNTIKYNNANYGGGLVYAFSDVTFDSNLLNTMYLNYAGKGSDIHARPTESSNRPYLNVIVDTFTVTEPDFFHLFSINMYGHYQQDDIIYDIQNAKIEQVEHDLYVAADGDDENSGLTASAPLQNIHYALTLIKADSLNHRTIHVADGLYSPSANNQYFPLHMKSYVSIIGESRENTIFDAEGGMGLIVANDILESWDEFLIKDWSLKNFNMTNGFFKPAIFNQKSHNVLLKNLELDNSIIHNNAMLTSHFTYINIDEIYSHDNMGGVACLINGSNGYTINLTNFKIEDNGHHPDDPEAPAGTGFLIINNAITVQPDFITNIINTEITNNVSQESFWPNDDGAMTVAQFAKVNLINSTISDNSAISGGAIVVDMESELHIYNSILYRDSPREIVLDGSHGPNYLSVQNSLVEGGEEGILDIGYNIIDWAENNLDEDPLFMGVGDNPYALTEDSPCIDMGTLDLPEGVVLPTYDLAGNPRICGSSIDMGCYEYGGDAAPIYLAINEDTLSWSIPAGHFPNYYAVYLNTELQGTVTGNVTEYIFSNLVNGQTYTAGVSAVYGINETAIMEIEFEYEEVGVQENITFAETSILNYPNPFNPTTTIKLNLSESGKTKLAIYNIKGQRVKKLINAYLEMGQFNMEWQGKDDDGKQVASGQYILKLEQNGKITATKIMLLK